mmetsp:Transcript_2086/g.6780  ORF Transcript_2086/g.6780 Transcript_2086/m.6780 type:complete len:262 (-) Transcript_2086:1197-1982(-)
MLKSSGSAARGAAAAAASTSTASPASPAAAAPPSPAAAHTSSTPSYSTKISSAYDKSARSTPPVSSGMSHSTTMAPPVCDCARTERGGPGGVTAVVVSVAQPVWPGSDSPPAVSTVKAAQYCVSACRPYTVPNGCSVMSVGAQISTAVASTAPVRNGGAGAAGSALGGGRAEMLAARMKRPAESPPPKRSGVTRTAILASSATCGTRTEAVVNWVLPHVPATLRQSAPLLLAQLLMYHCAGAPSMLRQFCDGLLPPVGSRL